MRKQSRPTSVFTVSPEDGECCSVLFFIDRKILGNVLKRFLRFFFLSRQLRKKPLWDLESEEQTLKKEEGMVSRTPKMELKKATACN